MSVKSEAPFVIIMDMISYPTGRVNRCDPSEIILTDKTVLLPFTVTVRVKVIPSCRRFVILSPITTLAGGGGGGE